MRKRYEQAKAELLARCNDMEPCEHCAPPDGDPVDMSEVSVGERYGSEDMYRDFFDIQSGSRIPPEGVVYTDTVSRVRPQFGAELAQQTVVLKRVRELADRWNGGSELAQVFAKQLYAALAIHSGDAVAGRERQ